MQLLVIYAIRPLKNGEYVEIKGVFDSLDSATKAFPINGEYGEQLYFSKSRSYCQLGDPRSTRMRLGDPWSRRWCKWNRSFKKD